MGIAAGMTPAEARKPPTGFRDPKRGQLIGKGYAPLKRKDNGNVPVAAQVPLRSYPWKKPPPDCPFTCDIVRQTILVYPVAR